MKKLPASVEAEPVEMGLTVPKEKAAECLADGGRFWQAAEVAGVDIRTVSRWAKEEEFIDHCVQLRQAALRGRFAVGAFACAHSITVRWSNRGEYHHMHGPDAGFLATLEVEEDQGPEAFLVSCIEQHRKMCHA